MILSLTILFFHAAAAVLAAAVMRPSTLSTQP